MKDVHGAWKVGETEEFKVVHPSKLFRVIEEESERRHDIKDEAKFDVGPEDLRESVWLEPNLFTARRQEWQHDIDDPDAIDDSFHRLSVTI